MAKVKPAGCLFCQIASGELPAQIVLEEARVLAFLDHRPLFVGHVLLIPKAHHETLTDLPASLIEPLFSTAQRLARAVVLALDADGTFVAMNNSVSQSVPHLHVHIVPRKKKDGLRGFFWPRRKYAEGEIESTAEKIRAALSQQGS
ncbi:MAG TPA: HIT family protein [Planctomycetota bacterium]|nr:HIT family protein [Planctomycetota bacterium]